MNEIVLSEEQMYLLKRMTITLFPLSEFKGIEMIESCGGCYVSFESKKIHWLEFCLFYIQPSMQVYISSLVIRTLGAKYVNLLYERFKKTNHATDQRIEEYRSDRESA